jgi:hypothetical protein
MSRHITQTRGVGASIVLVTTASLLLAGCTSTTATLRAVGQPSFSIDAPLTAVACTTTGACVTLGASGGSNAPTAAAQVRNHKGVWSALNVPPAPVASFYTGACATTTCYFGGTQDTGDLIWSVNADTGATSSLAGPSSGLVIRNLSCSSDFDCVALDDAAHHHARWSSTTTAGTTWSTPRPLPWATNKTTALSCASSQQCDVATTSPQHVVTLRETLDAGAKWSVVTTPSTWTSLTSLYCSTSCVALVATKTGSAVATPSTATATTTTSSASTGEGWDTTPIAFAPTSFSCSSVTTCVVVGRTAGQVAAMAQWQSGTVRSVALTYVPSPLTNVACEPSVCVAIAVTTVVSLRP